MFVDYRRGGGSCHAQIPTPIWEEAVGIQSSSKHELSEGYETARRTGELKPSRRARVENPIAPRFETAPFTAEPEVRFRPTVDESRGGREGIHGPLNGPQGADVPLGPREAATRYVLEVIQNSLESSLWKYTTEALSTVALGPAGLPLVRTIYLGKQLYTVFRGLANGDGFIFKVSVPGLGELTQDAVPEGLDLVARVTFFDEARGIFSRPGLCSPPSRFRRHQKRTSWCG